MLGSCPKPIAAVEIAVSAALLATALAGCGGGSEAASSGTDPTAASTTALRGAPGTEPAGSTGTAPAGDGNGAVGANDDGGNGAGSNGAGGNAGPPPAEGRAGGQGKATRMEPATKPSPEGTGPERPRPETKSKPYLSMPQPPIGLNGGGEVDDDQNTSRRQCVDVSYAGPTIPDGIRVSVTPQFDTGGRFDVLSSGCGGNPPCEDSFLTAARPRCVILVEATGTGQSDRLSTTARVWCGEVPAADCTAYTEAANGASGGPDRTITLDQPEPAATPEET